MVYRNSPTLHNEKGEIEVRTYTHQPLTIDHFGIRASIKESGKVVISGPCYPSKDNPNEDEYDEVEIPASLVFKLATLLRDTRTMTVRKMSEVSAAPRKQE